VAELKQFYQSADVLILPSSAENSPCVIVEAQYFGLPVIATKIGGIPEMVNESKGILFSAKSSPEKMKKEIFHAMREFLQRKSEFDSSTIKDSAQLQFHPDNASLDLVKTYASLKFTDQP
jgi:glycosyltransferase involved in cell wall biosynthesis